MSGDGIERQQETQGSRLAPGDRVCLATAGMVLAAITLRLPWRPQLLHLWPFHAALFFGYWGLARALAGHRDAGWARVARGFAVVAVMFTLYSSLARVAFEVFPWNADAVLDRADRFLFLGRSPVLEAERLQSPALVEPFAFVYAFFIPYLYLSILLGLVGRPDPEREEFVIGFAMTYGLSFVGYLLLPARGPIVHQAAQFAGPLEGGFFLRTIVESIDAMGGPHGAFPSLHVGASSYFCLFDLRHRPVRGWLYLPVVLMIAVSTVFVRYHYAVDLLAGFLIAAMAAWTARRWTAGPERRRLPSR